MNQIRPTISFLLLLSLLFGAAYPLLTTSMANAVFPHEAQGSLLTDKTGKPLGSALVGQNFTQPHYFWGRISATAPYSYNASASSGSNYGSNNPALLDAANARITALRTADPLNTAPVPVDLVTASGSGLDPHISVAATEYQLARVARARGLSEAKLRELVAHYTQGRQFGVLGEPRVNVLKLNLALDGKL
ncbi:MAG: potassium-transporting ATPase subunit KdpC [Pseudomonadota bacterium]